MSTTKTICLKGKAGYHPSGQSALLMTPSPLHYVNSHAFILSHTKQSTPVQNKILTLPQQALAFRAACVRPNAASRGEKWLRVCRGTSGSSDVGPERGREILALMTFINTSIVTRHPYFSQRGKVYQVPGILL